MNRAIIFISFISIIFAQDADTPQSIVSDQSDSLAVSNDSLSTAMDTLGPPMDLDYGYKGFMWGAPKGSQMPSLKYMDQGQYVRDSSSVQMSGNLGNERVFVEYAFSDSGFWKVEIKYILNPNDFQSHLDLFAKIERTVSEVYGWPETTDRIEAGAMGIHDEINIGFERAFHFSSWNVSPVKISLLLNSIVQVPRNDELNIFGDNMSTLKLVYYNPDYMVITEEVTVEEPLPSIFDIY